MRNHLHVHNGGQTIDTDLDQSDDTFQETDSGSGLVIALSFFVSMTVIAFFVGFFTVIEFFVGFFSG